MSDETKVPPGWVRLTRRDDGAGMMVRAASVSGVAPLDGGSDIFDGSEVPFRATESPADVAALIAAAEAAERRAASMPVMAAVLAYFQREDDVWGPDAAVRDAESLLAAIERERE